MRLEIVLWPDPVLLSGAQPVEKVDAHVREVVAEMRRVMFDLKGVGLAAPQVGVPLRLMLVCPTGAPGDERVLVNPRIVTAGGQVLGEEGCLSFPGIYGRVERAKQARVAYQDLDGRPQTLDLEGFVARIVQHEGDHLDGKVFVDRMLAEDRLEIEPELAELRARFAAAGRR
jgi:peptide deformylase